MEEHKEITDKDIDEFIEADQARLLEEYEQDNKSKKKDIPVFTERQKKLLTFSTCFSYFSLGLAVGIQGPILNAFGYYLGYTADDVSAKMAWPMAARSIGWIFGSAVASTLYERIRGNRILWIILVLTSIFMFVIPFSTNLWTLIVLSGLMGVVMSPIEVGVNTMILWVWKDKVGPFMQLLHFGFGLGLGASPFIVGAIQYFVAPGSTISISEGAAKMNTYYPNNTLCSSTSLISDSVLLSLISNEETTNITQIDDVEKQHFKTIIFTSHWVMCFIILISAVFPFILKSPPIDKDVGDPHAQVIQESNKHIDEKNGPASTDHSPLRKSRIRFYVVCALVTGFLFLYGGAETIFGTWITLYAENWYKIEASQAKLINSMFWLSLTVGRALAVPFSTKVSAKNFLIGGLGGCLLSLFALAGYERMKSAPLLWICSILLGCSMAPIFASSFILPAELKVRMNGKAASAFIIASGIGDMVFPPVVGFIIKWMDDLNGLLYSLLFVFLCCTALFVVSIVFGYMTMEKKLDETELLNISQLDDSWEFRFAQTSSTSDDTSRSLTSSSKSVDDIVDRSTSSSSSYALRASNSEPTFRIDDMNITPSNSKEKKSIKSKSSSNPNLVSLDESEKEFEEFDEDDHHSNPSSKFVANNHPIIDLDST